MKILDIVENPVQLKKMTVEQLEVLAGELRELIIDRVSKNGGHIAPNLGVVELTIAMHKVFSCPEDKFIWDVGHQAYSHKILTGRRTAFSTLRQKGGIKGYPRRLESNYDAFGTGHSSTSISAALGFAIARDLRKGTEKVIAVIGDGALTGGQAFEAINHAGMLKKDIVIILNDNGMSVDKNVGALAKCFSKIRIKSESDIQKGESKNSFLGKVFGEMGFSYIGPVDGHNIVSLIEHLEKVKNMHEPVIVHVRTVKGKGYAPAELAPDIFHEVSNLNINNEKSLIKSNVVSYREVFGNAVVDLAKQDEKIVVVTPAQAKATGVRKFAQLYPNRFFDVGIAEQHSITLAAGLAAAGMKPIVTMTANFVQRAYDQIIHDVCLQNLPVIICLDRAGFFSKEGPTHHGVFENSYFRCVPNITIMLPKDENELRQMMATALEMKSTVVIRYPYAGRGVDVKSSFTPIPIGKFEILSKGGNIAFLAIGTMVETAEKVAKILREDKIKTTVINARFVKPLDEEVLRYLGNSMDIIITLEENVRMGGFGSAVLEFLNDEGLKKPDVIRLGIPDYFIEQGTKAELLKECNLDVLSIVEKVKMLIKRNEAR